MRSISVFITLMFALAPAAGAQQVQRPATTTVASGADTIGIVKVVVGEWFEQTLTVRRQLVAGQEIPQDSRLVAGPFLGGGADTRAIELAMYDGSERAFRCGEPAVCDGPIPVAIAATSLRSILRDFLRRLYGVEKLTPLIIGETTTPLRSPSIVTLERGKVQIRIPDKMTTDKTTSLSWCTIEDGRCEAVNVPPRKGLLFGLGFTARDTKVAPPAARPGLYTLRGESFHSVVLAVSPQQYQNTFLTFSQINNTETFVRLPNDQRWRAQELLLQILSDRLPTTTTTQPSATAAQ